VIPREGVERTKKSIEARAFSPSPVIPREGVESRCKRASSIAFALNDVIPREGVESRDNLRLDNMLDIFPQRDPERGS